MATLGSDTNACLRHFLVVYLPSITQINENVVRRGLIHKLVDALGIMGCFDNSPGKALVQINLFDEILQCVNPEYLFSKILKHKSRIEARFGRNKN